MPWKCFVIARSPYCRLSLRRFTFSKSTVGDTNVGFREVEKLCPKGKGYSHDASVLIAHQVEAGSVHSSGKGAFQEDSRWPVKCEACEYVFAEEDQWQVNYDELWKGAPDGKLYTLRDMPPGATWHADWFPEGDPTFAGPDGKVWCVMMPGGVEWIVYGPSRDAQGNAGAKWQVAGAPPAITVHPSIGIGKRYHGFIKGGIVSEDYDGRKFLGVPRTA